MLQLVVNNEKAYLTCKDCQYYDQFEGACGIYQNVADSDPFTVTRCSYFRSRQLPAVKKKVYKPERQTEKPVYYSYQGQQQLISHSTYPHKPDRILEREDAYWFVSPDQQYGCWIINHFEQRFMVLKPDIEEGWSEGIYKSINPLHDHQAPLMIASSMAWFVDEQGYGQYVMLNDQGEIIMLTAPKLSK
jgi:hypothetical protein